MKKFLLFAAAAMVAASASASEWVSIINGGNAAEGESASIQAGWNGPAKVVANPSGEGVVYETPIAADPANPWDSQMFIIFNEGLQAGDKYKVSFEYYCSDSRTISIQAQGNPGAYQHWTCGVPELEAKAEWQTVSIEAEITSEMAGGAGFKTMAFNLASAPEAATFYVNKVVVEKEEAGETPVDPDPVTPGEKAWVSIINGGVAADGQTSSIRAGWAGDAPVVANPAGEGVVFECPIAADPANPWDSQLFITFNEALQAGAKLKVSFDYYCTDDRTIETQAQGEPGAYHHWQCVGVLSAGPMWQTHTAEVEVTSDFVGSDGFKTIAFNLASAPEAATFYINNVVVETEKDVESAVEAIATVKAPAGVYNLSGVKVADELNTNLPKGIYIVNGKKVVR